MNVAGGPVPRALADAIVAHQRRLGAGPLAEANARALGDGALVVVAGQQPGLLGGPLLSLHKAAGAVALARDESARLGRRVVPAFWIASEDHDWGEVNRATVVAADGSLRDLSLDVVGDQRSVRDVPVPAASVERLLAALAAALPATDRARAALDLVRPAPGDDLGAWFGTVLARWLGDTGLVLLEPHVLAPFAGPAFARLVEHATTICAAVRAAGARRRAAGLAAPLDPKPSDAPLFLRSAAGGPRARVSVEGRAVHLPAGAGPHELGALRDLVLAHPELASGDVVGRVFVQDLLLPVVASVLGPAEAAYHEQVRAAFDALSLPFPAVVARPTATWVDAKTRESLERLGVSLDAAVAGTAVLPPPPAEVDPLEVAADDLRVRVRALAAETRRAFDASGGGGEPPVLERALGPVERELDKAIKAHRDDREARAGRGRGRFERALSAVRPKGQPQERILSPVSLVARHGLDALRAGLDTLRCDAPHRVLTV